VLFALLNIGPAQQIELPFFILYVSFIYIAKKETQVNHEIFVGISQNWKSNYAMRRRPWLVHSKKGSLSGTESSY